MAALGSVGRAVTAPANARPGSAVYDSFVGLRRFGLRSWAAYGGEVEALSMLRWARGGGRSAVASGLLLEDAVAGVDRVADEPVERVAHRVFTGLPRSDRVEIFVEEHLKRPFLSTGSDFPDGSQNLIWLGYARDSGGDVNAKAADVLIP